MLRIRCNFRSTVRVAHCNSAAISSLESPSILQTATRRRSSSGKSSSNRWHSSATSAANSGVGSRENLLDGGFLALEDVVLGEHGPLAATLLASFVANQVQHLVGRGHHEQPPEIVAITKTRIATRLDSAENAMHRAQGHVFLIGCPQRPAAELVAYASGVRPMSA